jgi:hypothetical protein
LLVLVVVTLFVRQVEEAVGVGDFFLLRLLLEFLPGVGERECL